MRSEMWCLRIGGDEMVAIGRVHSMLETGVRIAADVMMVNLALAVSMMARCFVEIWAGAGRTPREVLLEYVEAYVDAFWILTIISVAVFYISGFYTRGRFYQGRYKALVVAEAVSLSYLVFGFVALLSQGAIALPRSVFFV